MWTFLPLALDGIVTVAEAEVLFCTVTDPLKELGSLAIHSHLSLARRDCQYHAQKGHQ